MTALIILKDCHALHYERFSHNMIPRTCLHSFVKLFPWRLILFCLELRNSNHFLFKTICSVINQFIKTIKPLRDVHYTMLNVTSFQHNKPCVHAEYNDAWRRAAWLMETKPKSWYGYLHIMPRVHKWMWLRGSEWTPNIRSSVCLLAMAWCDSRISCLTIIE